MKYAIMKSLILAGAEENIIVPVLVSTLENLDRLGGLVRRQLDVDGDLRVIFEAQLLQGKPYTSEQLDALDLARIEQVERTAFLTSPFCDGETEPFRAGLEDVTYELSVVRFKYDGVDIFLPLYVVEVAHGG